MSSFDADGFCHPPVGYDPNNRRGRLHRDKYEGLWWRKRANSSTVWEYKTGRNSAEDRSVTLDATTEREAIREWEGLRGRLSQGATVLAKGDRRLDDAWAHYKARLDRWVAEGKMSDKTRVGYSGAYAGHVQPTLGQAFIAGIDKDDLSDLFRDLTAAGLSQWTQCGIKNVLSHCFKTALAERWIMVDPLSLVNPLDLPKQQSRKEYEPRLFRNEELLAMFAACPPLYTRMLIVMAFTGMRLRELCGLKWSNVSLSERVIHVRAQLHFDRETKQWGTERPKGRRTAVKSLSVRTIDMLDAVFDALAEQLKSEREKGFGGDEDFVFTTSAQSGLPATPDNFRARGVRVAASNAGLGHVRPHDFRHTTASILAAAGVTDVVAAQMMGHTVEIYRSVYAKAFRDAIERSKAREQLAGVGFGGRLADLQEATR